MSSTIKIAICTDSHYLLASGPCVVSIFEQHKNESCHVYVISKDLSEKEKNGFRQIARNYNQQLTIVDIDFGMFKGLKICNRFRESIYYRFLIPKLFPDDDKFIYLDSDILVNGSLKALWDTDIDSYACGVVEDQEGDDIVAHNRIGKYSTYFNSGVLLMNLSYWRTHDVTNKLIDFIYNNPDKCLYPDQDALNYVLEGNVSFLMYKYNFQDYWYSCDYSKLRLHSAKLEEVKAWKENPVIVHFTGDNKPWKRGCRHPFTDYYMSCLSKTPWKLPRKRESVNSHRHRSVRKFNRLLIFVIIEHIILVCYLLSR